MKTKNNIMVKKGCGANVILIGHRCYRCKDHHEWLSQNKDILPKVCPKCKSPYWDSPRTKPLTKKEKEKVKNGKK